MNYITDGQISKLCDCFAKFTFQRNNNIEHILILVKPAVVKGWVFEVTSVISCASGRYANNILKFVFPVTISY